MSIKDDYYDNLKSHLDMVESQLEQLRSKAAQKSGTMKAKIMNSIEDLEEKYVTACSQLEQFRMADDENWQEYKRDIEIAWINLDEAYRSAFSATGGYRQE